MPPPPEATALAIDEQPDRGLPLPDNVRQSMHDKIVVASTFTDQLRDPLYLTRSHRLALSEITLSTFQDRSCRPDEAVEKFPESLTPDDPKYWTRVTLKNGFDHQRERTQSPLRFGSIGRTATNYIGLEEDYRPPAEATEDDPEQALRTLTTEIENIRDRLAYQLAKDTEIYPAQNEFYIDPSLLPPPERMSKIQKEVNKLLRHKRKSRESLSKENLQIIKVLCEATQQGKRITREKIAEIMGLDPQKMGRRASRKINKLRESLNASPQTELTITQENSPDRGTQKGYSLDIKKREEDLDKDPELLPPIRAISEEDRQLLIKILTHARNNKVREKKDSLTPIAIDCFLDSLKVKGGASITPEYCKLKSKNPTDTRNFDLCIRSIRNRSEEEYGFKIISGPGKTRQIVLPEDKENLQRILEEIDQHASQEEEIPTLTEAEFRRRVQDGQRHLSAGDTRLDKERQQKILKLMVEKALKDEQTNPYRIAVELEDKNIGTEHVHGVFRRVRNLNSRTTQDKYPSILGFTITKLPNDNFLLTPTPEYYNSPITYKKQAAVWPVPVPADTPEFDEEIFQRVMRETEGVLVPTYTDIWKLYAKYARKKQAVSSVILGTVVQRERLPFDLSRARDATKKYHPGIVSNKHRDESFYITCTRETYIDEWEARQEDKIAKLESAANDLDQIVQEAPGHVENWPKAKRRHSARIEEMHQATMETKQKLAETPTEKWDKILSPAEKALANQERLINDSLSTFRDKTAGVYIQNGAECPISSKKLPMNPVPIEGEINFDKDLFEFLIENIPGVEGDQKEFNKQALQTLGTATEQRTSISTTYLRLKLDKRKYPDKKWQLFKYWLETYFPGVRMETPENESTYHLTCSREAYAEDWAKLQNRSLEENARRIDKIDQAATTTPRYVKHWSESKRTCTGKIETAQKIIEVTAAKIQESEMTEWAKIEQEASNQIEKLKAQIQKSLRIFRRKIVKIHAQCGTECPINYTHVDVNPLPIEDGIDFERDLFDILLQKAKRQKTRELSPARELVLEKWADYADKDLAAPVTRIKLELAEEIGKHFGFNELRRQSHKIIPGLGFVDCDKAVFYPTLTRESYANTIFAQMTSETRTILAEISKQRATYTPLHPAQRPLMIAEALITGIHQIIKELGETELKLEYWLKTKVPKALEKAQDKLERARELIKEAESAEQKTKPANLPNNHSFDADLFIELMQPHNPPIGGVEEMRIRLLSIHAKKTNSSLAIPIEYINRKLRPEVPYTEEQVEETAKWLEEQDFGAQLAELQPGLRFISLDTEKAKEVLTSRKTEEQAMKSRRRERQDEWKDTLRTATRYIFTPTNEPIDENDPEVHRYNPTKDDETTPSAIAKQYQHLHGLELIFLDPGTKVYEYWVKILKPKPAQTIVKPSNGSSHTPAYLAPANLEYYKEHKTLEQRRKEERELERWLAGNE